MLLRNLFEFERGIGQLYDCLTGSPGTLIVFPFEIKCGIAFLRKMNNHRSNRFRRCIFGADSEDAVVEPAVTIFGQVDEIVDTKGYRRKAGRKPSPKQAQIKWKLR